MGENPNRSRKQNCNQKGDLDRLSNLPEDLIHLVLSFLDITDIMKTSLLSRQWRYVWCMMPYFNFNEAKFSKLQMKKLRFKRELTNQQFANFVNFVLSHRSRQKTIKKFSLESSSSNPSNEIRENINSWIHHAIKSKVEELSIRYYFLSPFRFTSSIFSSVSLTKLELGSSMDRDGSSNVNLPETIHLPNLKYMKLDSIVIEEKGIQKFISSLPSLKTLILTISRVRDRDNVFEISSVVLSKLQIENTLASGNKPSKIHLSTPKLESLIVHDFMAQRYTFHDLLLSIECAHINLVAVRGSDVGPNAISELPKNSLILYVERAKDFLKVLTKVTDLSVSHDFLEVIESLKFHPNQFNCLKNLKLVTWLSNKSFGAIISLLNASPNITSVFVEIKVSSNRDRLYPFHDEENTDSNMELESLPGLLNHLTVVKIEKLFASINELKLCEMFLKSSPNLEKLIISYNNVVVKGEDNKHEIRTGSFFEKLLNFPAASATDLTIEEEDYGQNGTAGIKEVSASTNLISK